MSISVARPASRVEGAPGTLVRGEAQAVSRASRAPARAAREAIVSGATTGLDGYHTCRTPNAPKARRWPTPSLHAPTRRGPALYQLIVPFFVVSTSSSAPALKRKALMFLVRKVLACGSITFRP